MVNSSLLQWLSTFHLDGQVSVEMKEDAYYMLADGYICARILNQISPQYFTESWLDGIKPVPPNGSWRLRVSNLKRILQKIYDYASDLQSQQFKTSAITPDVAVIAQNFDPEQISRLIQLILFCAINCDKKQQYIERIRNLPTQVKQDIKEAIEELLIKNEDGGSNSRLSTSQVDSVKSDTGINSSFRSNASLTNEASSTPIKSSPQRGFVKRNSSQNSFEVSKLSENPPNSSTLSNDQTTSEKIRQLLNEALVQKDEKAQACHELELKLREIRLERDQLATENERLTNENLKTETSKATESRRLSRSSQQQIDSSERTDHVSGDNPSNDLLKIQNSKLRDEIHRLKDDVIRIEHEKEDFRLKSALLQEDIDTLSKKHDEIRNKADQAKRLQDEIDELRQVSEKVVNYETMMEKLVKKNSELKHDHKSLEEKNLAHIQTIVKLEEENRQLTKAMDRFEVFKKQLQEAQMKLGEEMHRADRAEIELARVTERYTATRRENEKLYETTNQLMQSSQGFNNRKDTGQSSPGSNALSSIPDGPNRLNELPDDRQGQNLPSSVIELKEKLTRLEIENELLHNKLKSKSETDNAVLGGLLDNANVRCSKLELENRQAKKRILLLESRLNDLSNLHGGPSTSASVTLPNDSSSDNMLALVNRIEELQRSLFQREQELMESESKYKKNIQKAKDVIKTLNSSQSMNNSSNLSYISSASLNSSSMDEVNLLRTQLREREDSLIQKEREFSDYKRLKEVHERLVLSAFYGFTTPMQRRNAERRLERTGLTSPPNTAMSKIP